MFMIILNLVHILAGVFWGGAVLLLAGFVSPAVDAAGPAGGSFMNKLATETRFSVAMSVGGGFTVLSGLIMYWLVSNGFATSWLFSTHGILISVGAVTGILAAVIGAISSKNTGMSISNLVGEIQASGKPPSEAQQVEMQKLKLKMRKSTGLGALLILIAVTCMALARTI